jgi:hypothetical protein
MIVSQRHKFVFVHIPKNAGTTVETLLKPHLDPLQDLHVSQSAELPDNSNLLGNMEGLKLLKHIPAHRIRRTLWNGLYDDMFSFAISRNPYSRCLSAYSFIAKRAAIDEEKKARQEADPARDRTKFIDLTFAEVCARLPEIAKEHRLFRPQTLWLRDPDSVNFVGRLESLAEDLRIVYTRLGLPTDALDAMPVHNRKTESGDWRNMPGTCIDTIRSFYAGDFERFGYSTDFNGDDGAPPRSFVARPAPLTPNARTTRPLRKIVRTSTGGETE